MNDFILNYTGSISDIGILRLIEKIKNNETIHFSTSGTTGTPKEVKHHAKFLAEAVRLNSKFKSPVWALTYDYQKIAAAQVILQAYLSGGKIVNLYGRDEKYIIDSIKLFDINHISATPTFYRILSNSEIFDGVYRATVGGEVVAEDVIKKIKYLFPNAKVTNVYALTEVGAVLFSNNELFQIKEKNVGTIKIENDNIFIKKDGSWIDTGDIVEFVDEENFKIVGRRDNIRKIAGVLVNLVHIENVINSLQCVKNSYVYTKKNSVSGEIVFADISLREATDMAAIKNSLAGRLSIYEIPAKINLVEDIKINSNKKVSRI